MKRGLFILLSLLTLSSYAASNTALKVHTKLSAMTAGMIKDVLVEKGDYIYTVDFQDLSSGILHNQDMDLEDILRRNFQYLNDGRIVLGRRGTFSSAFEAINATFQCGAAVGGYDNTCRILIDYTAFSNGEGGSFGGGIPSTFKRLLKTAYYVDYNPSTYEIIKIYVPTQG